MGTPTSAAAFEHRLRSSASDIETLLESDTHEVRVGACSIMGKAEPARHKELFDLYVRRHDRIDTWDLVDLVAHQLAGTYLKDKPRDPLYTWARSTFWPERRSAVVATAAFLKAGDTTDTFALSRILLADQEELVQKGAGWMLRYAGDVDRPALLAFLDEHAPACPARCCATPSKSSTSPPAPPTWPAGPATSPGRSSATPRPGCAARSGRPVRR